MTIADLSVGPPGKPDQPPGREPAPRSPAVRPAERDVVEPDEILDGPPPVSHESVKGLVLGAANLLHQVLAARYEERPDIGRMNDAEADQIARALVSMSSRNPVLADILARSDVATLALVLSGYSGRILHDVTEAKRERRIADEHGATGASARHPGPAGPVGPAVGRVAGSPGNPGGDGGGFRPPDHRGMA